MSNTTIHRVTPETVHATLARVMLADGFDLVLD